jgi:hypothetical protein
MTNEEPSMGSAEQSAPASGRLQYALAYFAAHHGIKREQAFVILEEAGSSRERADEAVWKFKHH